MDLYSVAVVENISYKQFVCRIQAENESDAIRKAKDKFSRQFPIYSAHFRVILSGKVLN